MVHQPGHKRCARLQLAVASCPPCKVEGQWWVSEGVALPSCESAIHVADGLCPSHHPTHSHIQSSALQPHRFCADDPAHDAPMQRSQPTRHTLVILSHLCSSRLCILVSITHLTRRHRVPRSFSACSHTQKGDLSFTFLRQKRLIFSFRRQRRKAYPTLCAGAAGTDQWGNHRRPPRGRVSRHAAGGGGCSAVGGLPSAQPPPRVPDGCCQVSCMLA